MGIDLKGNFKKIIILLFFLNPFFKGFSSSLDIYVTNENGKKLSNVYLTCLNTGVEFLAKDGHLTITTLPDGNYSFYIEADFHKPQQLYVPLNSEKDLTYHVQLKEEEEYVRDTVTVGGNKKPLNIIDIGDDGIIIGPKKSEHTTLDSIDVNKSGAGTREIFYKNPGINIIQTDGAGIQLGIGGRGLDPHRSSNFNIRQNGYDISADALGYPESYYTPPAEAVESIELLRGAASLQYGTQFGGVVNFKMRSGFDKHFEIVSRQTGGSFGFFNSFNSIGGTTKKGIKYYTFFQSKTGDDYRINSEFRLRNLYGHIESVIGDRLKIGIDQTYMTYTAHQAGGLTDDEFEENPRQSNRDRNWFQVKWYVPSVSLEYYPSDHVFISSKFFGLIGERNSVGNLGSILREDIEGTERDLILGDFKNIGNETRAIIDYSIKEKEQFLALGIRSYFGKNSTFQGIGSNENGPDFNPVGTDNFISSYTTPNRNFAFFAENLFHITPRFTLTPGIRLENIKTSADGEYRVRQQDLAGNDIVNYTVQEQLELPRTFLISGIGASYKISDTITILEAYSNLSQNYRSVTFADLRISNPSFRIDSTIHDEEGFNFDIGFRGEKLGVFNFDISAFWLQYDDRIGEVLKEFSDPILVTTIKRFRTNVSDARILGVEAFAEGNILKFFNDSTKNKLSLFFNGAYIKSEYINSSDAAINGNQVEYVPELNIKTGIRFRKNRFGSSLQYSYTSQQFSDATNTFTFPDAIFGIIPSYSVVDLSLSYRLSDHFKVESGLNNLTNTSYFTKRTTGYPGPGILPASGRSFYLTLEYKL